MDNTQKIILGLALATLVIAIIFFFTKGDKNTAPHPTPSPSPSPTPAPVPPVPEQPMQEKMVGSRQAGPERVLVMFFAPWCGHCKNMSPAWDELTQNFDGYNGVKIVAVNGQENPQLCQTHGVAGFPTVKYCPAGIENPEGVTYQGDRSVASLAQFLQQHA